LRIRIVIGAAGGLMVAAALASAQPPPGGIGPAGGAGDLVTRMMAFDKDKSGTLTRAEVTDDRLVRLFDRADTDKDGVVTRSELNALQSRERGNARGGGGGPGGPGGGFGGGPGGPMMGGPPPRPGTVLPTMLQDRLNLTADQKAQLSDLQKDVDARLAKILTDDQKAQLQEMRPPRGGPGGGGPGGPFGGGPPPPRGDRP
jgi:hypothetical protein